MRGLIAKRFQWEGDARRPIKAPVPRVCRDCRGDAKSTLLAVVSLLVIIGSLIWMLHQRQPAPKPVAIEIAGLGQGAAEETLKLFSGPGTVVVVMAIADGKSAATELQMAAVKRALEQRPGISVIGPVAGGITWGMNWGPGPWLAAPSYFEVLKKYPQATAIISFAGAPALTESDLAKLPPQRPKLVAFTMSSAYLNKLCENQVVDVAVVRHILRGPPGASAAPGATAAPMTPREWFDTQFGVRAGG